jgi:hypothetical protein
MRKLAEERLQQINLAFDAAERPVHGAISFQNRKGGLRS